MASHWFLMTLPVVQLVQIMLLRFEFILLLQMVSNQAPRWLMKVSHVINISPPAIYTTHANNFLSVEPCCVHCYAEYHPVCHQLYLKPSPGLQATLSDL